MVGSAFLGSASACNCVLGWICVRSTLLLCSQPFATVCNRLQPSAVRKLREEGYGRDSHFWRFQTLRNVVSCGRRGALWHSSMYHNALRFFWQAQYFCERFFRRRVAFYAPLFLIACPCWYLLLGKMPPKVVGWDSVLGGKRIAYGRWLVLRQPNPTNPNHDFLIEPTKFSCCGQRHLPIYS